MLGKIKDFHHKHTINVNELSFVIFYGLGTTLFLNQMVLSYVFDLKLPDNLHNHLFRLSIVLLLITLQIISCLPFLALGITKYAIISFTFIAFITSYFSNRFGIIFDGTVTESVYETNYSEISQYFNLNLFLNLFLIIFISMALWIGIKVPKTSYPKRLLLFSKILGSCIVLILITASFFYKDYASFFRNNRQVRHMVTPLSPVYEISKHTLHTLFPKKHVFVSIGQSAFLKTPPTGRNKVIVLILGETARSDHFSLNGYQGNNTNQELSKLNVISLKDVSSCGTATATSVPCIFSDLGRKGFDLETSHQRGNLLDVAKSAGYQVTWIDNNTGCQGVCARINEFDLTSVMNNELCNGKTCYDEILLSALDKVIEGDQPHLIVLHMLGSHGPSYHLRYPEKFKKFQPSCDTSELSACTQLQIKNTYDNTILYTDYVLSKIVERLKNTSKRKDAAMVYISDHGESLGENGIYLHSLPYLVAPKAQTHVPAILWFSDDFLNPHDLRTVKEADDCSFSHDNIFSSLLTLLSIQTKEYRAENDIFQINPQSCKIASQ